MVAIEVPLRPETTFGNGKKPREHTTLAEPAWEEHLPARAGQPLREDYRGTLGAVSPQEYGQVEAPDVGEDTPSSTATVAPAIRADAGEAARIRSEWAKQLMERVDELLASVGDVSLPTHVELLKRDLSSCHDVLATHPTEGDFLSIVTLVESALAQKKWRDYSREQLEEIRRAFELGYQQQRVGHEDYRSIRRVFVSRNVDSSPQIDLESLPLEEFTDGEET